jgi:Lanthionine synthetase C-like protein
VLCWPPPQELLALSHEVECLPLGECELLYGRSGYLYALTFAQQHGEIDEAAERRFRGAKQAMIRQIVEAGRALALSTPGASHFGLLYEWHGRRYLGAAHGLAGG